MIVTKTALPRRTFLRGLGTALSLPLLDAMVPALSPLRAQTHCQLGPAARLRLHSDGHECGRLDAAGRGAPHRAVAVAHRADAACSTTSPSSATSSCATPTRRAITPRPTVRFSAARAPSGPKAATTSSGTTVDQIAARSIGGETQIPSLEIGTDLIAQVGNCDNGYACAYQNNLSWSSPTTPLPTEADPRVVFERLFGDGGSPERRRAELKKSGSILDWMTSDLARLQARARRRRPRRASVSTWIRCARWSAASSAPNRVTPRRCPNSIARPASPPCGKTTSG